MRDWVEMALVVTLVRDASDMRDSRDSSGGLKGAEYRGACRCQT
jgi:hypothetical protein